MRVRARYVVGLAAAVVIFMWRELLGLSVFFALGFGTGAAEPDPVGEVPVLPVVPKAAPAQPVAGLRADEHLDTTPPRATKGLDLVKMGWSYDCMECHRIVKVKWVRDRVKVEHDNILLNHGNNRFCLNCHNGANMNVFSDYDGSEIAEQDVVLLCAKCHGTVHRDWEAGVHGRRNGFWDKTRGEQTRLRCIQCHDPHNPKFKAVEALGPLRYPERAAGKVERAAGEEH